jgi:hypothetical protein
VKLKFQKKRMHTGFATKWLNGFWPNKNKRALPDHSPTTKMPEKKLINSGRSSNARGMAHDLCAKCLMSASQLIRE